MVILKAWVTFGPGFGDLGLQATVTFVGSDVNTNIRNGISTWIPFDDGYGFEEIKEVVKLFVVAMSVDLNNTEENRNITDWHQSYTHDRSTGLAWLYSVIDPANILMQSFV